MAQARADSPTPSSTAAEAESDPAASWYAAGQRAFFEHRWTDAEAAYLKAWSLVRSFDIAANLGQVELLLGKPRLAAAHLAYSLRMAPLSIEPAQRERLTLLYEEARKQVVALRLKPNVDGVRISIDGTPVPMEDATREVFVDPGTHQVTASRAGYHDAVVVVSAGPGASRGVDLALAEDTQGQRGTTAPPESTSPAGKQRSWAPAYVLGGASVVGLGLAVGMTMASNAASSDAREKREAIFAAGGGCLDSPSYDTSCVELGQVGSRAGAFGDIAFGSYIAAGALAIAAATYALWPRRIDRSSVALLIAPSLRMDAPGAAVGGTW